MRMLSGMTRQDITPTPSPLRFYQDRRTGTHYAKPQRENGYAAIMYRTADGTWAWESTLWERAQSEGSAPTLNDARDAVRQDYGYIAEHL